MACPHKGLVGGQAGQGWDSSLSARSCRAEAAALHAILGQWGLEVWFRDKVYLCSEGRALQTQVVAIILGPGLRYARP